MMDLLEENIMSNIIALPRLFTVPGNMHIFVYLFHISLLFYFIVADDKKQLVTINVLCGYLTLLGIIYCRQFEYNYHVDSVCTSNDTYSI